MACCCTAAIAANAYYGHFAAFVSRGFSLCAGCVCNAIIYDAFSRAVFSTAAAAVHTVITGQPVCDPAEHFDKSGLRRTAIRGGVFPKSGVSSKRAFFRSVLRIKAVDSASPNFYRKGLSRSYRDRGNVNAASGTALTSLTTRTRLTAVSVALAVIGAVCAFFAGCAALTA